MNNNNVNKFPSRGRSALVSRRRNNGRAVAAATTRRRLNQSLRFEDKVDVYDDPSHITRQEQEDYWYTVRAKIATNNKVHSLLWLRGR